MTYLERCAVCSDTSHGVHFGVMACRACAAFFRRSMINNRVYKCRFDGKCVINHREIRCSCRACRLKKCLELGMDISPILRNHQNTTEHPQQKPTKRHTEVVPSISNSNIDIKPLLVTNSVLLPPSSGSTIADKFEFNSPLSNPSSTGSSTALFNPISDCEHSPNFGSLIIPSPISSSSSGTATVSNPKQPQHIMNFDYKAGRSYTILESSTMTTTFATSSPENFMTQILTAENSGASGSTFPLRKSTVPSCSLSAELGPMTSSSSSSIISSSQNSAFKRPFELEQQQQSSFIKPPQQHQISASLKQDNRIGDLPNSTTPVFVSAGETFSIAQPLTLAAGSSGTPPMATPLIDEMRRGYAKFHRLRMMADSLEDGNGNRLILEDSLKKMLQHSNEEPRPADYNENARIMKLDFSLVSNLVNEHFLPLKDYFSNESKWALLRNFFLLFNTSERLYQTMKHYPEWHGSRLLISQNYYVDIKNFYKFLNVENCKTNPKELAEMMKPVLSKIYDTLWKVLFPLDITEAEMVAYYGLIFWNERVEGLTKPEQKVASETTERLFEELYHICRLNPMCKSQEELGIRFGNICNLVHLIHKFSCEVSSTFSLVRIANLFDYDSFFQHINPEAF